MIYSVILMVGSTGHRIASYDYWSYKITRKQLTKYVSTQGEMKEKSDTPKYRPAIIDGLKFMSRECGDDIFLVCVCDSNSLDDVIINTINRAVRVLRKAVAEQSRSHIKKNFFNLIDPFFLSRLAIALVGDSGVGKTSLLCLLMGKKPPEEHHPTIVVNTEALENIRFANYQLVIIDFAGQEQSRKLWDFSNADMVFLVTDSTLKNLIVSKGLLSRITNENVTLPVFVFANKQDLSNALDPSAIGKVLGVDAESLVAVDLAFRNNLLKSLVNILCKYFNLDVPDIPIDDLLHFEPEKS